jgi:simple sugar transport system permease protein
MADMKSYRKILVILSVILVFVPFALFFPEQFLAVAAVLSSGLRQSTPIVLGALCGLFCERSGVMNLGIEGQMLFSAYAGFIVGAVTGSPWLGVLAALVCGAAVGGALALMAVGLKADQIIAGTVINILALGLTGYYYPMTLALPKRLMPLALPLLADIPVAGPVLFEIPPITLAAIVLVGVSHVLLFRTRWGLRTRAVGEHPAAADTQGIPVNRIRVARVVFAGLFAGLAGAFLSLEAVGAFERGMTNGRGFIALAVMIFGRWTPLGAWGGALLFGLALAIQTQLQFTGSVTIPHQFTGMLPYLATVVVLVIYSGKNAPPQALGKVFDREGDR